ncbi:acyl-CoA carboxylase subunit epsilon [Pseudactinotalea sp.]|uniref:acyl-CoA carboxylase subunit epsilon n=1 Tax=Pseudactinotalea sp. TaxID=1926260 RepID=UPI003B3B90E5
MSSVNNGDESALAGEIGEVAGLVRVVRGDVDEEELAALVAGIVAARMASSGEEVDDGSRTSVWADPRRRWGVPRGTQRAAWRWSTHQAW